VSGPASSTLMRSESLTGSTGSALVVILPPLHRGCSRCHSSVIGEGRVTHSALPPAGGVLPPAGKRSQVVRQRGVAGEGKNPCRLVPSCCTCRVASCASPFPARAIPPRLARAYRSAAHRQGQALRAPLPRASLAAALTARLALRSDCSQAWGSSPRPPGGPHCCTPHIGRFVLQ